jgi:hypothetical protein
MDFTVIVEHISESLITVSHYRNVEAIYFQNGETDGDQDMIPVFEIAYPNTGIL